MNTHRALPHFQDHCRARMAIALLLALAVWPSCTAEDPKGSSVQHSETQTAVLALKIANPERDVVFCYESRRGNS